MIRVIIRNAGRQRIVVQQTAKLQLLLFDLLRRNKLLQLNLGTVQARRQLPLKPPNRRPHLARLELVVRDILNLENIKNLDAAPIELHLRVHNLERKQMAQHKRARPLHGALLHRRQFVVDDVAVGPVREPNHAAEVRRPRPEVGGDRGGGRLGVDDEDDDTAVDAEAVVEVNDDVLAGRVGVFGTGSDSDALLLLEFDDKNVGITSGDSFIVVVIIVAVVV